MFHGRHNKSNYISVNMIDYIFRRTNEYIEHIPKTLRKKYGQFFTSPETAMFMAELLTIPQQRSLSILDPGAGSGILSAALVEVLQKNPYVENIELVCYENDLNILNVICVFLQDKYPLTYYCTAYFTNCKSFFAILPVQYKFP